MIKEIKRNFIEIINRDCEREKLLSQRDMKSE